jgi:predicted Rossmann fold nucleotide-binding protein DprA/Smf involved in DNA uptake
MDLADGEEGQQMTITGDGSSFDVVVTPASLGSGTTITFDAADEYADMIFSSGSWHVYRTNATVA